MNLFKQPQKFSIHLGIFLKNKLKTKLAFDLNSLIIFGT